MEPAPNARTVTSITRCEAVYFCVDSSSDKISVAIRPILEQWQAKWEDTETQIQMPAKKIECFNANDKSTIPEKIVITGFGRTITMDKLTVELFNKLLKSTVIGNPSFESDEILQQHYLTTPFHAF